MKSSSNKFFKITKPSISCKSTLYIDNCISPTKKGKTIRFYLVLWCYRVKKNNFFLFKLMFLDYFNVLILKIKKIYYFDVFLNTKIL
jgi:hypothetical protein